MKATDSVTPEAPAPAAGPFEVPASVETAIDEVISHYPQKRSAVLMVLHALQDHFGCLSRAAVEWTARRLELEPINVYELVTFYPMFHRQPLGKYHLKVCRTLSCALSGAKDLHGHFCRRLSLDPAEHGPQTTPDGKYTLEYVECLAGCGTGPVMMCNEAFYEAVSEAQADTILKGCK